MFASAGAKSGFIPDEKEVVTKVWEEELVGVVGGSVISPF
jgi:hypothetical protein